VFFDLSLTNFGGVVDLALDLFKSQLLARGGLLKALLDSGSGELSATLDFDFECDGLLGLHGVVWCFLVELQKEVLC